MTVRLLPALLASVVALPTGADALLASQAEPLVVEVADDLVLADTTRNKNLPYKISFPKQGGPYPVIVFSHGYGGSKDAFAPVAHHWASRGYVVIQPTHADGGAWRRTDPPEGAAERSGRTRDGGLRAALDDPARIADRVADLVVVMDSLDDMATTTPAVTGRIDKDRIGVGGHSFGAYTAMLLGGVTVDLGGEAGRSFRDDRVRCILPISAQGTGQQGLTDESWAALGLPMMTITGTRDRGIGGQPVEWRKEPYRLSPAGDKYLVVIEGANHFSFGGRLGGRSSGVTDVVEAFSTHFWDAHLKDSGSSREYLRSPRPGQEAGGAYTFERK